MKKNVIILVIGLIIGGSYSFFKPPVVEVKEIVKIERVEVESINRDTITTIKEVSTPDGTIIKETRVENKDIEFRESIYKKDSIVEMKGAKRNSFILGVESQSLNLPKPYIGYKRDEGLFFFEGKLFYDKNINGNLNIGIKYDF